MNIAYTPEEIRGELLVMAEEYFRRRLRKRKSPKTAAWIEEWLEILARTKLRDISESARKLDAGGGA